MERRCSAGDISCRPMKHVHGKYEVLLPGTTTMPRSKIENIMELESGFRSLLVLNPFSLVLNCDEMVAIKVISMTNQERRQQRNEPIRRQSKCTHTGDKRKKLRSRLWVVGMVKLIVKPEKHQIYFWQTTQILSACFSNKRRPHPLQSKSFSEESLFTTMFLRSWSIGKPWS